MLLDGASMDAGSKPKCAYQQLHAHMYVAFFILATDVAGHREQWCNTL
jgi:hypothetical protein